MFSLSANLLAIYYGWQTHPTLTGTILGVIDDTGHTQMDTEISTPSVSLGQLWRWQFFMWVLAPSLSQAPEHNYAQTGSVRWKIKCCFYDAMKSCLFPPKKEYYLFPCVYGFSGSVEGLSLWNCWFISMSNVNLCLGLERDFQIEKQESGPFPRSLTCLPSTLWLPDLGSGAAGAEPCKRTQCLPSLSLQSTG